MTTTTKKTKARPAAQRKRPYVICRCSAAGVHAGVLESFDPATASARLSESRRLWLWKATQGVSLSDVAVYGAVSDARTRTGAPCAITVIGVCEVIMTSGVAEASIRGLP